MSVYCPRIRKGTGILKSRIYYLISGPAHLPYLVCSLKTLREHYKGEVVVYAWKESFDIVKEISNDKSLDIKIRLHEPAHRLKNAQFMDKIELAKEQADEVDVVLYLDADTTIHSPDIKILIEGAERYGFAATRFNNWETNKGIIRKRILQLRKFKQIDQSVVESLLQYDWPSVNGGVWAAQTYSPLLSIWSEWTKIAQEIFIADEIILHTLMVMFYNKKIKIKGFNGRWNTSPKYQPETLKNEDVVVYHYHGDCNVRINKSQKGYDLWWPIYQNCLDNNVGNINAWIGEIKNKWMDKLPKELKNGT